ncbi:hypothetical protein HPT27_06940 [Permianibacter sp. IMCC34836]|uniref:hypothetical protein n=1 Tax=Permianibacter fluminis TaxID=2738515 RepID=UPI0015553B26|nr:hypothetical protein [Permianibacter fluminis]NQD36757.1 hypothetical protein [Permianibacter fluminis]
MMMIRAALIALLLATVGVPVAEAASPTKMYSSAETMLGSDFRVVRTLQSFKRDGYVEVSRNFSQIMYLIAPTQDYKAGEYVITLRKSADGYSLTTYYAEVHVEVMADIETGRYFAGRVWTEESVVH